MNRQDYKKAIINSLTWLSKEVEINNKLNFTDINVHSEYFYRDLLNLAFGYNLQNINILEPNAAAIDLGDESNQLAIQVTSTSDLSKTKHTVAKFIEKGLHKKYKRLVILNIVKKANHREPLIGDENFSINTKEDIWDIHTLSTKLNDKNDHSLKQINDFLNANLYKKPYEALPKNVTTILNLINLISDENHPHVGKGYITEPFPEFKINERFSSHSEYLISEYTELYKDYGFVLKSVSENADLGQVKIRRVAQYIRDYSDEVLTESNGDPDKALRIIINNFSELLRSNQYEFDSGAIKFYLLQQLIDCNVFPNKEAVKSE